MMSTISNGRGKCSVCNKDKITYECTGCTHSFCYKHLTEHRQIFIEQLSEVENDRNEFQEIFLQQKDNLSNHVIMQKITKWENDSIKRIKQTAEECRQVFMEHAIRSFNELDIKIKKLNDDIIITREENEFNEIVLEQLKIKLTKLVEELAHLPPVAIHQDSSSFINKISITSASGNQISLIDQPRTSTNGHSNIKYIQNGITIVGGNGKGHGLNQLSIPEGIFVDDDLTMYIADSMNNRILKYQHGEKYGQVVAGGNGKGDKNNQLDRPISVVLDKKTNSLIISDWGNRRILQWPCENNSIGKILIADIKCYSLAMDNNGNLYVANWKKHEVKRWKIGDTDGVIVAGGNGQGNNLNQLNSPNHIFIDNDYSIYISMDSNHRVVKWTKGAKEGIIIAGQNGQGNSLSQLSRPQGVAIDQFGQIYIADCDNHRVLRFDKGDTKGFAVVGGKGQGDQSFQLNSPTSLLFDKQGHLYVVDSQNHRIQKYQLSTS